jgi:hypothetical protein
LIALVLLATLPVFMAAKCYPPGTRVVVFVQGLYTTYDESGTQSTAVEGPRFSLLKEAFSAQGYRADALLDFSYTGGVMNFAGAWVPNDYSCEQTDRRSEENVLVLEQMLRDYRAKHPRAHFAIVGHSLGGYLAFTAGAREAARGEAEKLAISEVVTFDAPLLGADADKRAIVDLIACEKTYAAGAEIVALKLDAATPGLRAAQTQQMAEQGIRVASLGNRWDCLWNTQHCLPGSGFVDDSGTQFLPPPATALAYEVASPPLLSHDAILGHPQAVADAVAFVGAP